MTQRGICRHALRNDIDRALKSGEVLRDIVGQFGVSKSGFSAASPSAHHSKRRQEQRRTRGTNGRGKGVFVRRTVSDFTVRWLREAGARP